MKSADFLQAIAAGEADAVLAALARGPVLAQVRTEAGVSALLWALYNRRPEIAAAVAAAKPALDMFEAAALGDETALGARLRVEPGAHALWSADGFQLLHLAAFFARPGAVALLLAAGADANAKTRNAMGLRPLHSAAAARSAEIVASLLAAGADPDARQEGGFTALMAAAMHKDAAMVEALLAVGADVAVKSDDGRIAADFARAAGHGDLATRLDA